MDLIVGTHSIHHALDNNMRVHEELVATDEGLADFLKLYRRNKNSIKCNIRLVASHQLQEEAKRYFIDRGLEFYRVPSGIFLLTSELETFELHQVIGNIKHSENYRMLALDQITDVQNAAAIFRTASFFGINAIIVGAGKTFAMTPGFYRISSGAAEHITIIRSSHFSRAIDQLKENGVVPIALTEHAEDELSGTFPKTCLILGSEDKGISNAVLRLVDKKLSLKSQGAIKSLNVSVAASLAMQICFRPN